MKYFDNVGPCCTIPFSGVIRKLSVQFRKISIEIRKFRLEIWKCIFDKYDRTREVLSLSL